MRFGALKYIGGLKLKLATPPVIDIVVAIALLTFALIDLFTGVPREHPVGDALLAGLIVLPIALRRHNPVFVGLILATGLCVQALLNDPFDAIWLLIVVVLAVYSIAANAPTRPAIASTLLICAAIGVSIGRDPSDDLSNVPPTLVIFVLLPFMAGLVLKRRHLAGIEAAEIRSFEAVADERSRIARELHDVVAHNISMIAIQADAAELALRESPDRAIAPVRAIRRAAVDALEEMQRMLVLLRADGRSTVHSPQPGIDQINELVEEVRQTGIAVDYEHTGKLDSVSPGVALCVYRVVQEGLTNAIRHAGGAPVRVSVSRGPEKIDIVIADSGTNANGSTTGTGLGLLGLRERLSVFNGSIETSSTVDGWRLAATVPVAREEASQ